MKNLVKDMSSAESSLQVAMAKNDLASRLIMLLVNALPVPEINGLFKVIITHVKIIVEFDAADLLVFATGSSAKHTRLSYSKAQFYEFLNVKDPLLLAAVDHKGLSQIFMPDQPRQISQVYWLNRLPPESLFFKKETEFRYSYFMPILSTDGLKGLLLFRTNRQTGFGLEDQAVFQLIEGILLSKLTDLLSDQAPDQNVDRGLIGHTRMEEINSSLLALSYKTAAIRTDDDLIHIIHHQLKEFFPGDYVQIYRAGGEGGHYYPLIDLPSIYPDPIETIMVAASELQRDNTWINSANLSANPIVIQSGEVTGNDKTSVWLKENFRNGVKRVIFLPLGSVNTRSGLMVILLMGEVDFAYLDRSKAISRQVSAALNNIIANEKIADQFREIDRYKQQLEIENHYLQEEIETTFNYGDIIGISEAMQRVFYLVSQVAETQSSVLILGETGTGKELIARALHNASPWRKKLMIKVNCAALPANLIESELFGHEKGSFTGASERRIGKFELANNSTLFLDEIGELPLELQVKLLRALQEKEIERIGGTSVIKVNVRIVTATNRNLLKEVQAGNFRSDLYFRLNVFPITLPALRDRKEDISLLAVHFLEKQSKKTMARVTGFSAKVMKQLRAYDWPGNVRELEHLIERSVLLTKGTIINQVPILLTGTEQSVDMPDTRIKTIDEIEREHILIVLKKCNNKVAGIGGAANVLKIPASTLNSKMRRLKIKRAYEKPL